MANRSPNGSFYMRDTALDFRFPADSIAASRIARVPLRDLPVVNVSFFFQCCGERCEDAEAERVDMTAIAGIGALAPAGIPPFPAEGATRELAMRGPAATIGATGGIGGVGPIPANEFQTPEDV